MRTALDFPPETLDGTERSFVSTIQEHGWFRTEVRADASGPGFSYTTGFWLSVERPEFIVFALKDDIAHQVFWSLFRDAQAGRTVPIGVRTNDVFGNLAAYIFPVAPRHYANHLGWSRWFYDGDGFPCAQIIWPDREGLFPWEPGFDAVFADDQPDLTENGWRAALAEWDARGRPG